MYKKLQFCFVFTLFKVEEVVVNLYGVDVSIVVGIFCQSDICLHHSIEDIDPCFCQFVTFKGAVIGVFLMKQSLPKQFGSKFMDEGSVAVDV